MRGNGKSAQAMIEMAMLAPMIFMLLIFVFDLARAAATWAAISEAAREGSRNSVLIGTGTAATDNSIIGSTKLFGVNLSINSVAGCVHGNTPATNPGTPAPAAANSGYIYIIPGGTPSATTPNAPQGQGAEVNNAGCNPAVAAGLGTYPLKIVIAYKFTPFTPFASQFMPGGITMTASSTMNTEF
jgi:Flp pilus assembly protein TadG